MTATVRELTGKEQEALAYLDQEGMDAAIERSGLTREEIVEANNLRAAHRRLNGGVSVVDVPLPQPAAEPATGEPAAIPGEPRDTAQPVRALEELLARADEIGSKHARYLAERIRAAADDLRETLVDDEATWGARQRRAALLEARARLDGQIAELDAELRPAAVRQSLAPSRRGKSKARAKKPTRARTGAAASRQPADANLYYSPDVRSWAREHGHTVGSHGRIRREVVAAYLAAQQQPAAVVEVEAADGA